MQSTAFQRYIGTKILDAVPMTKSAAESEIGNTIKSPHDSTAPGYLVQYKDGYLSWSPADVFEENYRVNGQLTFADALYCLENGYEVQRTGSNGKDMSVFKPAGDLVISNAATGDDRPLAVKPAYVMLGADGQLAIWAPSQSDMMAKDWAYVSTEN